MQEREEAGGMKRGREGVRERGKEEEERRENRREEQKKEETLSIILK